MSEKQNPHEVTIDQLALGFAETNEKFAEVNERIDKLGAETNGRIDKLEKKVDDGFLCVNARLDTIERDIKDLDVVTRGGFDDFVGWVKCVEMKLGIESGK